MKIRQVIRGLVKPKFTTGIPAFDQVLKKIEPGSCVLFVGPASARVCYYIVKLNPHMGEFFCDRDKRDIVFASLRSPIILRYGWDLENTESADVVVQITKPAANQYLLEMTKNRFGGLPEELVEFVKGNLVVK